MLPEIMTAIILLAPAEYEPYWVCIRRPNGRVANTGRPFHVLAEAYAFVEGLDMAARLYGGRVLLDEQSSAEAETFAASRRAA